MMVQGWLGIKHHDMLQMDGDYFMDLSMDYSNGVQDVADVLGNN